MGSLVARLRCWLRGRHIYRPDCHRRQWLNSKRKHVRFEFRYQCHCCKRWTRWQRWSKHAAFEATHNPSWSNR